MGKRTYRTKLIKDLDVSRLKMALNGEGCVVGIDVAKTTFFASVMDLNRRVHVTVRWTHPAESGAFISLVSTLAEAGPMAVAMEPTGVYGDALREKLLDRGHAVHRVSPGRWSRSAHFV